MEPVCLLWSVIQRRIIGEPAYVRRKDPFFVVSTKGSVVSEIIQRFPKRGHGLDRYERDLGVVDWLTHPDM